MGRFPVTLYKEQWLKLLNMSEEIRAFIAENETRLKAKDWQLTASGTRTRYEEMQTSFKAAPLDACASPKVEAEHPSTAPSTK
jgi:hypothetical protein